MKKNMLCAGINVALASALLFLPPLLPGELVGETGRAWAANECGTPGPGPTTITCPPRNYPSGISYPGSNQLTLVLNDPGITVNGQVTLGSSSNSSINATNFGSITSTTPGGALWGEATGPGSVTVTMSNGTVNASVAASGIFARTYAGGTAAAILHGGVINVSTATGDGFGGFAAGVAAWTWGGSRGASSLAEMDGGTINATGADATALGAVNTQQLAEAATATTITARMTGGTITATGARSRGVASISAYFPTNIEMTGGLVSATGPDAIGLMAQAFAASAPGSYTINISGGTVIGGSGTGTAILAMAPAGGTINVGAAVTIDGSASGTAIAATGGNAIVTTAGVMKGDVILVGGNDSFTMTAGQFTGSLRMGGGNDTATFSGLTNTNLSGVTHIDGGSGTDTLTFDATSYTCGPNIINWEQVQLTHNAHLTLNGDLVLGDAGPTAPPVASPPLLTLGGIQPAAPFVDPPATPTGTGVLSIDATSMLSAGGATNPTISAIDPTLLATVNNAGAIDLRNSAAVATNSLTIVGNYVGQGGTLALNTYLGDDHSPSDRLIISRGSATGTTALAITNVGGPGDETSSNGIPVVQTTNGGTTAAGAFTLAGELRAGAYQYRLFQGGLGGSNPQDWFLRSDFEVAPQPPTPPPPAPEPEPPPPIDPPPVDPLPPGIYPIIGPELAAYGVVQPIARQMGLTTLGTLHERIGDTLTKANAGSNVEGWAPSAWARAFGQQIDNTYHAFAAPKTNGSLVGFQTGLDVWRGSMVPDQTDAIGVYFAYGHSSADVDGLITNADATGYMSTRTGTLSLDSYSGGAYWTHYGPGGWYIDGVFQGTHFNGHSTTTDNTRLPLSGSGYAASLEAGYPFPLAWDANFVLEPQAQVIWQRVLLSKANDGQGDVALGSTSGVSARLGVRGQWTITSDGGDIWQPYVRANIWRDSGGASTTTFSGSTAIPLNSQATRMDVAGGVTTTLRGGFSLYGQIGYQFAINNTDLARRNGVWGDIGVRLTW